MNFSRSIRYVYRILPMIGLVALMAGLAAPAAADNTRPKLTYKAMQSRLAACATCHGKNGEGDQGEGGGVYPRLAGQPAGYLYKQLLRFKSARRTGIPPVDVMHRLLENLPASYLQLIADFYHEASPPYPPAPPRNAERWKRGRDLVRNGVPSEGIAACTSCHGANLEGQPPNVPALAGQYARYLTIQFEHWKQGARENAVHEHIVQTLTTPEIEAMSHYLASLRLSGSAGDAE
ncbi:MAG TPA: c-type cytochrome [Gammaproteobacteria bacterium]|nr:c-type cytochrome [Gammaproteobacteria bacterium]